MSTLKINAKSSQFIVDIPRIHGITYKNLTFTLHKDDDNAQLGWLVTGRPGLGYSAASIL
jgi:hypothetical protein